MLRSGRKARVLSEEDRADNQYQRYAHQDGYVETDVAEGMEVFFVVENQGVIPLC